MASLDNLEGDLTEGTASVLALLGLALIVAAYISWKNLKVPYQLFPDYLIGQIGTGIDWLFLNTPFQGTSYQKNLDHLAGGAYGWSSAHLPSYANSQSWAAYDAANPTEGMASVDVQDYFGTGGQ